MVKLIVYRIGSTLIETKEFINYDYALKYFKKIYNDLEYVYYIEELRFDTKTWSSRTKSNPFCEACEEKDCLIRLDSTCAFIRTYQRCMERKR